MDFQESIKRIRQQSFLSQESFARELNVSFSSVNRWEGGRTMPNLKAMKNIQRYCKENKLDFGSLEGEWLSTRKDKNK